MKKKTLILGTVLACALAAQAADANVGAGLRAGTFGFGADLDIGLVEKLNLRLGYNGFSYDYDVDDEDVSYKGKLKISSASAVLDWHAFGGGFRFSLGAVGSGPKIDVDGTPAPGTTVEIGNNTYTAAQVGSLKGTVKIGDSVSPYVGIGWGNPVGQNHRVTFLFDLGAIHTGKPKTTLAATCGPALNTANCNILQQNVALEKADLDDEVGDMEWYPVVALGIGVRF